MAVLDDKMARPAVPRKGDQLFRGDLRDWMNNACLNVMGNGDAYAYKAGYRRGAEVLIGYVGESARDQDFLVYPIIFLYRHHVELMLKRIIRRAPYLIDGSLREKEKQHLDRHRLDLLWEDLKLMLPAVCKAAGWSEIDDADIEGIGHYIRQLCELDADSFSFRYAHSKKGDPSLPTNLKNINLRHFGELMGWLADYLYGLDEAISWLAETKSEMEAEWASEMAPYADCE
ncbi:MAG: hypothetical protein ACLPVW_10300 [Terriglobales bacterium]